MNQTKTVFDMTHVLTQGIIERKVREHYKDDSITVEAKGYINNIKLLSCKDFEFNLLTAMRIAESAKANKIKLLKKQIEKLESTPIKIIRLGDNE